jgi:hypothetical protein
MKSSKGLSNISHQPLLEFLIKPMTINTLCMLEITTKLHTLTFQNFRYKTLKLQIHAPHKTYNFQTMSLVTPIDLQYYPIIDSYTYCSIALS